MGIEFRTCHQCNGYGVLDNGHNCRMCGGSGEIMIDSDTGRRITARELEDVMTRIAESRLRGQATTTRKVELTKE